MKKIIALAIIALIWIHWGALSNEMGTLMMSLSAIFVLTNGAKAEKEKK